MKLVSGGYSCTSPQFSYDCEGGAASWRPFFLSCLYFYFYCLCVRLHVIVSKAEIGRMSRERYLSSSPAKKLLSLSLIVCLIRNRIKVEADVEVGEEVNSNGMEDGDLDYNRMERHKSPVTFT